MNVEDHFTIGFLDYPQHFNRPVAGTEAETLYCRGWVEAQKKYGNQLELELEFDSLLGRDTYAVDYVSPELLAQRRREDQAENQLNYRR